MRQTELLIEAIEESEEFWYENFDSIYEAKKVISTAIKEEPEEYEIGIVISTFDIDGIEDFNLLKSYKQCLRKLKKDLENNEDYE